MAKVGPQPYTYHMPRFDFVCQKCGHTFEFSRPFGSKVQPACPECKSKKTEKMITPPAVHFKGSGWYKTDSRSGSAVPVKKTEPAVAETKTVETKTEGTKTAEKTAPETKAPAKERTIDKA